ncbi:hypothetical protein GVAV_001823 [Gurleya vavrai]
MQRTNKLEPKYIGPYIVQKTTDSGSAIITDANNIKNIIANEKDLKLIAKEKIYNQFLCDHETIKEKKN